MNQFERALYFYKRENAAILAAPKNEWAIDPYAWEQLITMTPIEWLLWGDIRAANAVFYPQYPVDRYFADFANPVARVVIECDGAAYHQDRAKDAHRDAVMRDLGWSVYRISGRDCHTDFDDDTQEYGYARKFIESIVDRHGLRRTGFLRPKSKNGYAMDLLEHIVEMNQ